MAIPEKIFRDALVGASSVTDLIGQRAYFMTAPQGATLPYVVIQLISNPRRPMISAADTIPSARIQVDVIAADVGDMGDVRDAIRDRMDVFSNSDIASCRLSTDFTSYDEATEYPRAVMEFRLTYFES